MGNSFSATANFQEGLNENLNISVLGSILEVVVILFQMECC